MGMWGLISLLLNFILLPLAAFMILLILIQRGKGGGLIGALGGIGGSSPVGSRAGDTFTKITLYMALVRGRFIMIQTKVAQGADVRPMKKSAAVARATRPPTEPRP